MVERVDSRITVAHLVHRSTEKVRSCMKWLDQANSDDYIQVITSSGPSLWLEVQSTYGRIGSEVMFME